jgi:DNA-binding NtrC family response regulator
MKPVILCVDDEKIVLVNLIQQLKSFFGTQFQLETAESAEEALEVIEDVSNPIILLITDWLMPGMKGDEFLIQFSQKHPNTISIMLSGQADDSAVERAVKEAKLYAFIKKPWQKDELIEIIQKAIDNLNNNP